tara:strand:- start:35 stop:412 length:378 start_codon:yes stop_codon:yes gene_type:complete
MKNYFNTEQFTEVFGGVHQGTTQFRDNKNPGVVYTSTPKGIVRRVIQTKETVINKTTGEKTVTYVKTGYVINPRDEDKKYVPLLTLNSRLQRIQHQANKFNKKRKIIDECKVIDQGNKIKIIVID